MYICNVTGLYVGPDKCHPDDLEVPDRPSPDHKWENGMWVMDEEYAALIAPTAEEIQAQMKGQAVNAIQGILDAKAKEYGFDTIHTAAVWQDSKNPNRAARAIALMKWGDAVWDFAETEWVNQEAGTPTYTEIEAFLEALPEFVEPA